MYEGTLDSDASLEENVKIIKDEVAALKINRDNFRDSIERNSERIERLEEQLSEREMSRFDYIRELSEQKYEILKELRRLDETDRTQTDIAEEHDVDRSYITKLKKEFEERGVL